MPHFVIECSENILRDVNAEEIMDIVYQTAEASGLFAENDIKVRIRSYADYKLGEGKEDFLHVFAYIMEGRTSKQKADLSRKIIEALDGILPSLSILSMNVADFDRSSYCNKALIDPGNTKGDRHFKGSS
jgi:5-carboxymethyl-2-hydroxymuconate isomerase